MGASLPVLATVFFGGTIFGSFCNALAWRAHFYFYSPHRKAIQGYPKKLAAVFGGRSRCPVCRQSLDPISLIPVLGWLIRRGKCYFCRAPVSVAYPLGELLAGLFFLSQFLLATTAGLPPGQTLFLLFWWLPALSLLWILFLVDGRSLSIDLPALLLLSGWLVGGVYLAETWLVPGLEKSSAGRDILFFLTEPAGRWKTALGAFLFFLMVYIFSGGRMGWGDVLLSPLIGFWAGHPGWMFVFNGAFILATAYGLALFLARQGPFRRERRPAAGWREFRKARLPLGSFMLMAVFFWQLTLPWLAGWRG